MNMAKKVVIWGFLKAKGFQDETLKLLNDTNLEKLADDYEFYKEVSGIIR